MAENAMFPPKVKNGSLLVVTLIPFNPCAQNSTFPNCHACSRKSVEKYSRPQISREKRLCE
eukprot:scaffold2772_cov200-Cylindrotheca_fusiformis.AAC.2